MTLTDVIQERLHQIFTNETRVTNQKLKQQIQQIYDEIGSRAIAKGTDILKYGFTTKKCKITIDGKRRDGVILTSSDNQYEKYD